METIRVGMIGFGANTRLRHAPGLLACPNVSLDAVCNRSLQSSQQAAAEYNIARTCERWEQVVEDPNIDAICIGTWPYMHCPITLGSSRGNMYSPKRECPWMTTKLAKCIKPVNDIRN